MAPMAFVPKHNQVGFLKKPEGSAGFEQIVDFLKGTHIRIDNLEKELKGYKQTTAAVIVKLVKKVKKLETRVKYGNLPNRKMVLSDSESEDAANSSKQGRNLGEEDVFKTPKGTDSGEGRHSASLSGLQVWTLVQVASQKTKTYTRKVKSGLKKKLDVGVSSGDKKSTFEKFKSASEEIELDSNLVLGEVEEEASLAEIARIQAQEAAKIERKAKLQRLDELADKRLNDELEMTEQQRKRATEDYANKMVELVKKRRREIREQKLKAKKNKPMTQAEQRNYMMNYVQFERTIRSIKIFIPMDSEKEKESLKRSGETLQGAEKKKQKVLDVEDIPIPESAKFVKEEEIEVKQPVLKMSRRKSKARKGIGLHTSTEPGSGESLSTITSQDLCELEDLRHGGKRFLSESSSQSQIKGIQCL
ncbi:hypothetical protein Tco_1314367 [Tanacetum coccineum]